MKTAVNINYVILLAPQKWWVYFESYDNFSVATQWAAV